MVGTDRLGQVGQNEYQSQFSDADAGRQEQNPFGVITDRTPPPTGRTVPVVTSTGTVIGSGTFNPSTGYLETDIRTTTIIEQTSPSSMTTRTGQGPAITDVPGQDTPIEDLHLPAPFDPFVTTPKKSDSDRRRFVTIPSDHFEWVYIRPLDLVNIRTDPSGVPLVIATFDSKGRSKGWSISTLTPADFKKWNHQNTAYFGIRVATDNFAANHTIDVEWDAP
jgi:hypothetical protein